MLSLTFFYNSMQNLLCSMFNPGFCSEKPTLRDYLAVPEVIQVPALPNSLLGLGFTYAPWEHSQHKKDCTKRDLAPVGGWEGRAKVNYTFI